MKNVRHVGLCAVFALLAACKPAADKPAGGDSGNLYFDFTVDGKALQIAAADITTSYNDSGKTKVLKIFAGKDGEPTILLTIPHDLTQPSTTPNGSANFDDEITQGSVSLQNYPEKNYTTNSFNTTYPEMAVVAADAVVVTASDKDGDKARIITGTFSATTYGTKDSKDAKDANHKVAGKFRIRHEL